MPKTDLQAIRRERLAELLREKYAGNKTALGKALGYKDGAYIGQWLRALRPISEKSVEAIERATHSRGWFHGTAQQQQIEATTGSNVAMLREPSQVWLSEAMMQFWRKARIHSVERRESVLGLVKELLKNEGDETQARATCLHIENLLEPPMAPAAPATANG